MDLEATARDTAPRSTRFEHAGPRRFLLPAALLLVAEEPSHGYALAKGLADLHLGRVDRPSVYRALTQLESDGFVTSSTSGVSRAGNGRRYYTITPDGERVLRQWMGVVKDERDGLDRVLRRYVAGGSLDARLAEVAGGWEQVTAPAFAAVSTGSRLDGSPGQPRNGEAIVWSTTAVADETIRRFDVNPERSVVLIEARSSVGPISFGALGVTGWLELNIAGGRVCADVSPRAHLEFAVDALRSGNAVYDAELMRRMDVRRHPVVVLDLRDFRPAGSGGRYTIHGDVACHGVVRRLEGSVEVTSPADGTLVVAGEQTIDIRDFGVVSPTVLMLRIYPDVVVKIQVEAHACADEQEAR